MSGRNARRRTLGGAAALAGLALAAAACGGSSGGGTAADTQPAGNGGQATGATVMTKQGPLGTYLTDGSGRTLYRFAADTGSSSTCTGSCAHYWPPMLAKGAAKAGSGASNSALGTTKRADGTRQVTYAGHPVYYYLGDAKPGDTKGQGLNLSGGLWWVVAPSSANITAKAGNASSSSDSGYGGGYGG